MSPLTYLLCRIMSGGRIINDRLLMLTLLPAAIVVAGSSPAQADSSDYPARCELFNAINPGITPIVGQARGLQGFVVPLVIVLVVAVILVAAIPRLRQNLLSAILWTLGLIIIGIALVAIVDQMAGNPCSAVPTP